MVQIEFDNNQMITVIQANLGDLFKDVINKYLGKTLISPDIVSFVANGCIINPNLTVEKQMNNFDKENKTMKVMENLQFFVLALLIVGQCVVGEAFFIGQGIYFVANLISVIRTFVLKRPVADKIKDVAMLGITAGLIVAKIVVR